MKLLSYIIMIIQVISFFTLNAFTHTRYEVPGLIEDPDYALYQGIPEEMIYIVVTSYNNADWYIYNLKMLFEQDYSNFHIIYVDDRSDDSTAELVENYIKVCGQEDRVTLIKNKDRKRSLANTYYALQLCPDDAIVMVPDGDDLLGNRQVLKHINYLYHTRDIWITYGQFINWPTNQMGYCKATSDEVVENQWYRKKWWMPGQLRTFRAWLFKQVKLKDLLFEAPYFQGQIFPANSDLAIYYAMMEMAYKRFYFIDKVIYIRNVDTPLNDFKTNKEVQVLGSKLIREKQIYPRLKQSREHYFDEFNSAQTSLIIFSDDWQKVRAVVDSVDRLAHNYDVVHIFYQADEYATHGAYQALAREYEKIQLHAYKQDTCKTMFINCLQNECANHVLFATDHTVLVKAVDFTDCICKLERAFAYGFYLSLGKDVCVSRKTGITQPLPALNEIAPNLLAWGYHYAARGDWRTPHVFDMALYRAKDIITSVENVSFDCSRELLQNWQQVPVDLSNIGLCFAQPATGYMNW